MERTVTLVVDSVDVEVENFLLVEIDERLDTGLMTVVRGQMESRVA